MTGISAGTMWVYIFGTVFTDTLWQGLIIGLSLFISTLFLKPADAKSRYRFALVAIVAMLVWTGYDLLKLIQQGRQFMNSEAGNSFGILTVLNSSVSPLPASSGSVSALFKSLYLQLGNYYYYIVPLWITGIFLLSLRLAGGWMLVIRVRSRSVFPLSQNWENCLAYLVNRLNIGREVLLKGSYKVTSPMVIGYLKPVILVPASVISSLSYSEMEAILAHELAHILRHDFLFICLQNVAEIILFYHPVTWLISSFLNKEREKCCDDIAVSISNDSLPFAKAITIMEDLHVQKNMPASFLLGRSNDLLVRIKRILQNGIRKSSLAERMAASVIITTGLCLIFAFAGFAHTKTPATTNGKPEIRAVNQLLTSPDTLKKISSTTTVEAELADGSSKGSTSYKITYENDTVKDLMVNKKKISREQLKDYKEKLALIKKLEAEHNLENTMPGWRNYNHPGDFLPDREAKLAMEKAMLDMQLHQGDLSNMKQKMDHLQLDKLKQELMMEELMQHSSDSLTMDHVKSDEAFFPKMDEKQKKELVEMKIQMEKLQKQMSEEMRKFQEEFQKTHGKTLDSLKREMHKLQKNMPMFQGSLFLDPPTFMRNSDMDLLNSYSSAGPGWNSYNPDQLPDTAAMDDKLRKLEK